MTGRAWFRVPTGGRIDRGAELTFTFDGRRYQGFSGDTVASALLANGVRLVGRSFKYHRPRGIYAAGVDEPNALITVGEGARREPNLRATQVVLYEGLRAVSQNRWPSLRFDLGAFAGKMSALLPAGFYYKTFMWPPRGWRIYEWFIRRAAGLGRAGREPDSERYAHKYAHCDVLVVGAGPSGLAAALSAGRTGARVLLVEDDTELGGSLLALGAGSAEAVGALSWRDASLAELGALPNVELLRRTTAFGYYDHNTITLSERVTDHLAEPAVGLPRHRLWYVRARQVVLAAGALERPIVFGGNDRPGVMLASAARRYLNHYGVRVARRAVFFTNNDTVYPAVVELARAGVEVALVVDARAQGPSEYWARELDAARIEIAPGHLVVRTRGGHALRAVDIRRAATGGAEPSQQARWIRCDGLFISGGWTPSVHLFAQAQGKLAWREDLQGFVPGEAPAHQHLHCAGAMTGAVRLADRIHEGLTAGARSAAAAGFAAGALDLPPLEAEPGTHPAEPLWSVPSPRRDQRFVDLQNDVTADDVALAVREGYRSVEHLKRYTTLGMGTDQGRLSNLNGLANLALERNEPIPAVGFTTFRPPFAPVALGMLAGDSHGPHLAPFRLTPMHDWHVARGAKMVPVGRWLRAECYPGEGETLAEAAYREARAVRAGAGLVDVSTLGKIELQGSDVAEFLERVYVNRWKTLRVGRARYGLMLRDDGMVFDDGTTSRIGEQHFYMTTTTGEAEAVMQHLERHAQVSWPELDVTLLSVTDQWGAMALAGPRSRDVLAAVVNVDVSNAALPFMGYLEATIEGVPCRVFRITFSGELAYEIHVPAGHALAIWQVFLRYAEPFGVVPYGTEAMAVLRIEKGHVVAAELDGRTTPGDVGFAALMRADGQFIGHRAQARPGLAEPGRLQLVGVRSLSKTERIPRGGHLIREVYCRAAMHRSERHRVPTEGHMTSTTYSPNLQAHVGLGLLTDGRARIGERLWVAAPLARRCVAVEIVQLVFLDPEGERARG